MDSSVADLCLQIETINESMRTIVEDNKRAPPDEGHTERLRERQRRHMSLVEQRCVLLGRIADTDSWTNEDTRRVTDIVRPLIRENNNDQTASELDRIVSRLVGPEGELAA